MSLFIGNISRNVEQKTMEATLNSFGPCKIEFRQRYAFVIFSKDSDAEAAKKDLNNKDFGGLRLNVEWSKKSGRFEENDQKSSSNTVRRAGASRSRSPQLGGKRRKSPSWGRKSSGGSSRRKRSASLSIHSTDCPRDRELKTRLNEAKRANKDITESNEEPNKREQQREGREKRDSKEREKTRKDSHERESKKERKNKDKSRERKRSRSGRR